MNGQATNEAENGSEAGRSTEEEFLDKSKATELSSTSQAKLYSKLRALEVEIDAVAYTVQQARNTERNENHVSHGNDNRAQGDAEDDKLVIQASPNNLTL